MSRLKILALLSVLFVLVATTAKPSAPSDNLTYLLDAADCSIVKEDHAFRLHAINKYFHLQKGFNFYGYELGRLAFRKFPDLFEAKRHTDPDAATYAHMQQLTNINYYESEQWEDLDSVEYDSFVELNWSGFSLLYSQSEVEKLSGQPIFSNQIIVRVPGEVERLWFSSINLENITNIIACASDE